MSLHQTSGVPASQSAAQWQVMWNRLLAVVEEQAQTLIRAAFSPIVRECGDISAGIFDFQGRMLAQAVTGTPGHINTMAAAVHTLRNQIKPQHMRPGDIYTTNDPWIASGHLNDFLLLMPVFYQRDLVAFTACTSHLVDLGGLGMGPEGSDIYDEGLLIPPCTLVQQGEMNTLLLDISQQLPNPKDVLRSFSPEGEVEVVDDGSLGESVNGMLKRQDYKVSIEGTYQETQDFLDSLERLQPLMLVSGVDTQAAELVQEVNVGPFGQVSINRKDPQLQTSLNLQALIERPREEFEADRQAAAAAEAAPAQ